MITRKPLFRRVAEYLIWPDLVTPVAEYSQLFNDTPKKSGKYPKYKVTPLPHHPK
jgi:hypothetical protein